MTNTSCTKIDNYWTVFHQVPVSFLFQTTNSISGHVTFRIKQHQHRNRTTNEQVQRNL